MSAASGLSDTAPDSDLAGRYARGFKAQDLLVLRRADRTADRLADTAGLEVSHTPAVGATLGKLPPQPQ